ncbi:MAG TPA: type II toxin-antitoxin system RelE/ParE family toxin [Burkholderiaceae bacterium]|jgi:plasmid stabilization system protein ParE|nr:type II toxin-antitoxin system RelE/ParE family toxin [Burkholderiaceae bacterium]
MARVDLLPAVLDDLDRIFDHLAQYDVQGAPARVAQIVSALDVLVTNPQIGRPVRGGKRELVIGRGTRGYLALYRYTAEFDTVFVLAVRSQKEGGYKR